VQQAEAALAGFEGDVLILFGDVPFVRTETMRRMLDRLAEAQGAVVAAFRPDDPRHYGRILAEPDGTILKMVEYKDASEAERALDLCNSGLMAVRASELWPLLARVGNANAAGEYYLPDIVMIAAGEGRPSLAVEVAVAEVEGINSRAELAAAEAAWQERRRAEAMAGRHPDRAGDGLVQPRHQNRPRRARRAERFLRPRRDRRRPCPDPRFLPYRGRDDRGGRGDRPLCAAAPGGGDRRGREGRQFRRG
jgi:bifunctional N-acetylglucosamine-1-phosphate-uridyltransferase/glucosamine-1-phosphate-acetyltransferase GlmU-like protein